MKKYKLIDLAKNKLRPEDKCGVLRLSGGCDDIKVTVLAIYELAGR